MTSNSLCSVSVIESGGMVVSFMCNSTATLAVLCLTTSSAQAIRPVGPSGTATITVTFDPGPSTSTTTPDRDDGKRHDKNTVASPAITAAPPFTG